MRRRFTLLAGLTAVLAFVLASPLSAGSAFPEEIALPRGFQPEGIATGKGATFFVGSIPTGAIYRGSLRTGEGAVLVPAQAGRAATGVFADRKHSRLFVAGAGTGAGYVYNSETGANIASYQFATPPGTFINDVFVTKTGAFFTDSFRQVLYMVPIAANGDLGATAQTIPLTGDIVFVPGQFNANGIEGKRNGKVLIVVQSNTGKLFTVSPTGVTDEITLTGGDVTNGDGMLLDGKTLYVVRNANREIAVVRLAKDFQSGTIVSRITHPRFDTPTTVDEHGKRLYVVNARFGAPQPADYWLTQVRKVNGD